VFVISDLIAMLEKQKAREGDVPVFFPAGGADVGRYLSVKAVAVVPCAADVKGMRRAEPGEPAVPCLVLYN
jgi:hypothetical protein